MSSCRAKGHFYYFSDMSQIKTALLQIEMCPWMNLDLQKDGLNLWQDGLDLWQCGLDLQQVGQISSGGWKIVRPFS